MSILGYIFPDIKEPLAGVISDLLSLFVFVVDGNLASVSCARENKLAVKFQELSKDVVQEQYSL